jgi:hypothetical protein
VLFTEKTFDGHLGVVELDVRCACCGGVACLDEFRLDCVVPRDQNNGESAVGLAAGDEVVAEHAVRDPLLGAEVRSQYMPHVQFVHVLTRE